LYLHNDVAPQRELADCAATSYVPRRCCEYDFRA
jgi:hypothetical protein